VLRQPAICFLLKLLPQNGGDRRVKVHYIGYGEEFDEWKHNDDIEVVGEAVSRSAEDCIRLESGVVLFTRI